MQIYMITIHMQICFLIFSLREREREREREMISENNKNL